MKRMLILIVAVLLACVGGKGRGAGDRLPILSAGVMRIVRRSAGSDRRSRTTGQSGRQRGLRSI